MRWAPETSGRVSAIQIQSRIKGATAWTEQAAAHDPTAGVFTFTSNAPGALVEVRIRFRMVSGVFSPWVMQEISTATVKVPYADVDGAPQNLGELDSSAKDKLDYIQDGATHGAPPGTPFGPGTVDAFIRDRQTIEAAHLRAIANAEVARIRDRGLHFPSPDGASTYTLHRREEAARTAADEAFAETFELLGAVAPDGSAFVLNGQTVKVTKTEAGATVLQSVNARFEDNESAVEQINQAFVDENGAIARAMLRVDVNDRVIGFSAFNDGRSGSFTVAADKFTIEDPDTGTPFFYADDTGKVVMKSVEVDTIAAKAVTGEQLDIGSMGTAGMAYDEAGQAVSTTSWTTISSVTVTPAFGKPVKISFSSFARCLNDASAPVYIRVIRDDGTVLYGGEGNDSRTRVEDEGKTVSFNCVDGTQAGRATTYTVQAKRSPGPTETVSFAYRMLYAEELSRLRFDQFTVNASTGAGPGAGSGGGSGGGDAYDPNPELRDIEPLR